MALEAKLRGLLIVGGFVLSGDLGPALGIPNFKTAVPRHQFDILLEMERFALILGKQYSSLGIGGYRTGFAVDLTDDPALHINAFTALPDACRKGVKILGRHDHQVISGRVRDGMELIGTSVQPSRRNRDTVLRIHGSIKSPGITEWSWFVFRHGTRVEKLATFLHYDPLLPTNRVQGQRKK